MRRYWSFATAGQLVFGSGAVDDLGRLLAGRGLRRVQVVSDANLVQAGLVARLEESLRSAGVACDTFTGGEPEPTLDVADRAVARARQFGPEGLVGLGGGSNLDLAKVVAVIQSHGGTPRDYFGFDNVPGPLLPLICVPTTAGTGSEVSHAAVLTDAAEGIKVSTLSPHLRPALACVDPSLTYGCPRKVTADSGIDALTHAIEALTANDYDKLPVPPGEKCAYEGRYELGDCLAERSIALIGRHLVRAVEQPDDRAARDGMALAATLAGMAFSNCGVALVHALEYPIGGEVHCSHGEGNGLLLPHVMRFNLPCRRETFRRIAQLLGQDTSAMTLDEAAEAAVQAVDTLRGRIGVRGRLRDLGATRDQLPRFAARAFAIKRLLWVNPRPASEADLLGILEAAF